MKLKLILTAGIVGMVASLLGAAAAARADPFAYVPNSGDVTNFFRGSVSQYDIGAGGLLAPLSPATVAAGDLPVRGGGEPGRPKRLRHQRRRRQRLPVRHRRGRAAGAIVPGHRRHRHLPVRGGGEPGRGERLRRQLRRWQRLPVRRRRGRGALAEEPGHGGHRCLYLPGRGGGEPGRGERLRHQRRQRQRLPVRRRRGRGALAEEPGHGGRRRPARSGWR